MMERQAPPIGHDPEVEELLESSWRGRGRAIRGRELRLDLAATALLIAVVGALVAASPGPLEIDAAAAAVAIA